jgi:hypothetical protein
MPRHTGVVDHNEEWGVTKLFHRMHDDDWAYETIQDVEPILDANKEAQAHGSQARPFGDLARHVARIPLIFAQKWYDEKGIDIYNRDHAQAVLRLLEDPDWRWLRTDNSTLTNHRVSQAQIERRLAQRKLWAEL